MKNVKTTPRGSVRSTLPKSEPQALSLRALIRGNLDLPEMAVLDLLTDVAKDIDSPLARKVEKQIALRDYIGLLGNTVDPSHYDDWEKYFWDNQLCKLLSKYPHFPVADEATRAAATLKNFEECEAQCAITNDFLYKFATGRVHMRPLHARVFEGARKLIEETLGKLDLDMWLDSCRFGPGVNAFLPKGTSDYSKLTTTPSVTEEFLPFAGAFISEFPAWGRALTTTWDDSGETFPINLTVARGGKYAQVPKKALIGRDIETQPSINGFAQRGLGLLIANALKGVGIDLTTQERNQELARRGSITGEIATIDLRNASNTNAYQLVRLLLPPDWFYALDITRTSQILMAGDRWVKLHHFSSMGNGYTFELETLIFWALARVLSDIRLGTKAVVSCFGDDIIVDSRVFNDVCDILSVVGFTPNSSKSFGSGPFRESCGADWFNGRPVRPLYIDEDPLNVASLISICNGLRRTSARVGDAVCHHRGFRRAWLRCVRWIPPAVRRALAYGDTVDDTFLLCHRVRDGFRIVAKSSTSRTTNWHGSVATALYRAYARRPVNPRYYDGDRAQTLIRGLCSPLLVSSRDDTTFDLARLSHDTYWKGGRAQWG